MIQPWRYFIQNELLSRIYFLCLVLSIESSTHQTTCVFFFILLRSLICSYNTLMILAHTSKMLLVYWNWTSYGAHFKTNSKQLVQPYSVFKASIHWCKFFSCKWCKFHILLFLATRQDVVRMTWTDINDSCSPSEVILWPRGGNFTLLLQRLFSRSLTFGIVSCEIIWITCSKSKWILIIFPRGSTLIPRWTLEDKRVNSYPTLNVRRCRDGLCTFIQQHSLWNMKKNKK